MSSDGGKSWTNVFKGQRNGDVVTGTWADVPRGGSRSGGALHLRISSNGPNGSGGVTGWRKIMMTGGFSGSSWYMPCGDTNLQPAH